MGKGDLFTNSSGGNTVSWYFLMLMITEVAGLIGLILIGVLLGNYSGGFNWGAQVFNYHPLLMALGMIFLYGNGILIYRIGRGGTKLYVKIVHAIILLSTLIISAVGLGAAFRATGSAGASANLKSLHSWFGLTTVILFGLQWVCGFIAYLFPKLNEQLRSAYMPSHRVWGRTIFGLALITFMMGIAEYTIYNSLTDASLLKQRNLLYVSGIMFLIFGLFVLYLIVERDFERPPEEKVVDEHQPLKD